MEKLKDFNIIKRKEEKKIIIGGVIIVVAVIMFLLLMTTEVSFIAFIVGFPGIVFIILGYSGFNKLSLRFKKELMTKLISEYIENGYYHPTNGLSKENVYATEFIKREDRFSSEDFISGEIEGVSFISSDVKLEDKRTRHTKNGTQTYYVTVFLGRVFRFDFNKSFDGYLQVLESFRPTKRRGYEKIKLESVAFNKKFKTYSTNEHSAFYVLTPHFMEALMKLEQDNKGSIGFSFIDNYLYIGINNSRDTFELRMFTPITDATFAEFERELLVIKDVISELKLNKNIFKEEN